MIILYTFQFIMSYKRIQKEHIDIHRDPPYGCSAHLIDGDLFNW